MQMHLHPTRNEALTASDMAITRWSLTTNPATILAQRSTAPESVFFYMYDPRGRRQTFGGITGCPDGLLFAHEPPKPPHGWWSSDPCVLEWRGFEDLSLARSVTLPHTRCAIGSLACSPDGRWLVLDGIEGLLLLDWQTGEVISRHATRGYSISGLAFDPTSTFVAGVASHDNWGFLMLWRLDPSERFVPRSPVEEWHTHQLLPQDYVSGSMALTLIHESLNREDVEWPNGENLADSAGLAAFSLDSRMVIFSLNSSRSWGDSELVAYEVPSGRQLWCVHYEGESSGPFVFSPDNNILLVPVQGGDLLVYRVEDGEFIRRLSSGLSEPVQALAFDHDGSTLWLATDEALVRYQPHG